MFFENVSYFITIKTESSLKAHVNAESKEGNITELEAEWSTKPIEAGQRCLIHTLLAIFFKPSEIHSNHFFL